MNFDDYWIMRDIIRKKEKAQVIHVGDDIY